MLKMGNLGGLESDPYTFYAYFNDLNNSDGIEDPINFLWKKYYKTRFEILDSVDFLWKKH